MPLKAVISSIEDVEEGLRSLYRPAKGDDEPSGKYVLDVEGVEGVEVRNFKKLLSALSEEREARETVERKLKKFKDLDPDAAAKTVAELAETKKALDELRAIDPNKQADRLAEEKAKALVESVKKEYGTTVEALNKRLAGLTGHLHKSTVTNALQEAFMKAGAKEGPLRLILKEASEACRVRETDDGNFLVEVLDEKGNVRIKDASRTPFGIADLVEEMKGSYPDIFKPAGGSGPGVPPGAPSDSGAGAPQPKGQLSAEEAAKAIREGGSEAYLKRAVG